jgi:hypothetical protein
MRTISLPGTGIYSRTTLRGAGSNRAQPSTAKSNSLALVLGAVLDKSLEVKLNPLEQLSLLIFWV